MKKELDELISQMWKNYEADVDDVCEQASAEMPLQSISSSKFLRIRRYLEDTYGIRYWLADKIKFNPKREYILWVGKTRGSDPVWGISPVTA